MKDKIAIVLVLLILISCCINQDSKTTTTTEEIIKGPEITGKYNGLWLPFLRETNMAVNEISELELDGINTVAIGIRICYNSDTSDISECEDEDELKNAINEFHKNGIRTMLILNPAHGDFGFDPFSEGGKSILDKLTPLVMKWAAIAEMYGTEMFSPTNEPQLLSYQNTADVENWAQEILPEIRNVYTGKVAFTVYNIDDNYYEYNLSGYDYILASVFACSSDIEGDENYRNHLVDVNKEKLANLELAYPNHEYIAFEIHAFTGPDYYWWEPIAPENMKNNPYNVTQDFFVVSDRGQADCYDMFFNLSWPNAGGYLFTTAKGFEYRDKPAEQVIRKWFNE